MHDSPSVDGEDRLHVQQRPRERLRATDPAALLQVLERADGEDDAVLARWNRSISASISSSVVPRARRRWIASASSPDRQGGRPGVDDADPVAADQLGRRERRDWNVPESFAESWSE